jgi:hypothetical protein
MQSHPAIQHYGELFAGEQQAFWNVPGYEIHALNRSAERLRNSDVAGFLDQIIYRPYPSKIKAVGFKLFYIQARQESLKRAWDYLTEDQSIKVIRLVRANYLAVLASKAEAMVTQTWVVKDKKQSDRPEEVYLDVEETGKMFEYFEVEDRILKERFKEHPYLYLTYESLMDNPRRLDEVQSFLNVPIREELRPETKKQARRTLRDRIANYQELKDHFAGTQWARFFED